MLLNTILRAPILKSAQQCSVFAVIPSRELHESSLPAGRGGRSSFSGVSATVFGASGLLGQTVVNRLARVGSAITLPNRNTIQLKAMNFGMMGDLGQLQYVEFDMNQSDDEIRRLIEYSNSVVNLIGSEYDQRQYSMEEINVEWPKRLARLCAEKNDGTKFLHVTNLACHQELGRKLSKILDQDYRSELAVREIYPETIIARSSQTFGYRCQMIEKFLHKSNDIHLAKYGSLPLLYSSGKQTLVRPCYSGDVGEAITKLLLHIDSAGKTFEFVGPKAYTLHDYIKRMRDLAGKNTHIHDVLGDIEGENANPMQKVVRRLLKRWYKQKKVRFIGIPLTIDMMVRRILPRHEWMSEDYFNMIHMSDITTGHRGFGDLGIEPDMFDGSHAYGMLVHRDQHGLKYLTSQDKKNWPPIPSVDVTPLNQSYTVQSGL